MLAVAQVPGSTLGPELAALLDNSEGSDINFKVCAVCSKAHGCKPNLNAIAVPVCNFLLASLSATNIALLQVS